MTIKLPRRVLLVLSVLLCCGIMPLLSYAHLFDPNFPCFGTFYPSKPDIGQRTNISFPQSTANLEWDCRAGFDGDAITMRFTIAPGDMQQITNAPGYYPHSFGEPSDYFFRAFDDDLLNEESLDSYSTWQGNSTCGWTNLLIDMDNPDIYTVYAAYYDWDDCSPLEATIKAYLP